MDSSVDFVPNNDEESDDEEPTTFTASVDPEFDDEEDKFWIVCFARLCK